MIKELIKLADYLDKAGFAKEADYLDKIIQKTALAPVLLPLGAAALTAEEIAASIGVSIYVAKILLKLFQEYSDEGAEYIVEYLKNNEVPGFGRLDNSTIVEIESLLNKYVVSNPDSEEEDGEQNSAVVSAWCFVDSSDHVSPNSWSYYNHGDVSILQEDVDRNVLELKDDNVEIGNDKSFMQINIAPEDPRIHDILRGRFCSNSDSITIKNYGTDVYFEDTTEGFGIYSAMKISILFDAENPSITRISCKGT